MTLHWRLVPSEATEETERAIRTALAMRDADYLIQSRDIYAAVVAASKLLTAEQVDAALTIWFEVIDETPHERMRRFLTTAFGATFEEDGR